MAVYDSIDVDLNEFDHIKKKSKEEKDKEKKDLEKDADKVKKEKEKSKSKSKKDAKENSLDDSYNNEIKQTEQFDDSKEIEGTVVEMDELPDTGFVDSNSALLPITLSLTLSIVLMTRLFKLEKDK